MFFFIIIIVLTQNIFIFINNFFIQIYNWKLHAKKAENCMVMQILIGSLVSNFPALNFTIHYSVAIRCAITFIYNKKTY